MLKKYYEILGLNENSSLQEVKKAYRRLAMKYHPDRNPGKESEEKFKEIKEAYERITNKDNTSNEEFREYNERSSNQSSYEGNGDFEDIFKSFFSEDNYDSEFVKEKIIKVNISILQGHRGFKYKSNINLWKLCNICEGRKYDSVSKTKVCYCCNGLGFIKKISSFFSIKQQCSKCKGKGIIIFDYCKKCKGMGRIRSKERLSIEVPKGVLSGTRFRIEGLKDLIDLENDIYSDIYIEIFLKSEKNISLDKNGNIHANIKVFFINSILGGSVKSNILGESIKINIPECTQNNDVILVSGKGYNVINSNSRTDLYIHIYVVNPRSINNSQRTALLKLKQFFC
ncbi:DnaJ domain-containing protein [Candidatus Vidania fulgoroideae]|uniref:DnaJ domain-containing protein n=1 Tax=Candidatus Vidania fulgoroideorum TaxID=881286 RepID=A0A975ADV0_9PROT|nr:DnaJ domain-containing protein [Candidatus Vidania fulgoroideae]